MRAEVERAFQVGGGVVTDEMIEADPSVEPVGGLGAFTPEPEPEEPEELELETTTISASEPGIGGLRELATMDRDDALARLRAGREAIADRRASRQKEDERAKWLALAQGMLAPTRTGAFGESLGTTAGLLLEEQERRRQGEDEMIEMEMALADQERGINQDYIRTMAGLRESELAQQRPIGTPDLFPHPDDPSVYAYGQQIFDPDTGEPTIIYSRDEYGKIPRAIDRLDAQVRAQIEFARAQAAGQVDRIDADIENGRSAYSNLQQFERALLELDRLEEYGGGTGGIQKIMFNLSNFFGVNDPSVTTMGMVNRFLGQRVLEGFKNFPGQLSDGERRFMTQLETDLGKSTEINRQLVLDGVRRLRSAHRRGIRAALEYGTDADLAAMGIEDRQAYLSQGANYDQTFNPDASGGSDAKGASAANPIDITYGVQPQVGKWYRMPDGRVRQWRGTQQQE